MLISWPVSHMYGTQQDLSDSAHATLGYCTSDSRYEEQQWLKKGLKSELDTRSEKYVRGRPQTRLDGRRECFFAAQIIIILHPIIIIWSSSWTTTVSSLSHTSAPGWVARSGGFRLSRMTAPPAPQHRPPPHITCDSEFLSTCGNISEKEIQILRISIELILRALKSSGSYSIQLIQFAPPFIDGDTDEEEDVVKRDDGGAPIKRLPSPHIALQTKLWRRTFIPCLRFPLKWLCAVDRSAYRTICVAA